MTKNIDVARKVAKLVVSELASNFKTENELNQVVYKTRKGQIRTVYYN